MVFAMQQQQSCVRNCSRWLFSGDLSAMWIKNWPEFPFLAPVRSPAGADWLYFWLAITLLSKTHTYIFQPVRSTCILGRNLHPISMGEHLGVSDQHLPLLPSGCSHPGLFQGLNSKAGSELTHQCLQSAQCPCGIWLDSWKSIRHFSTWSFYPINDLNFFFKAL